jgi:hypothetical protein
MRYILLLLFTFFIACAGPKETVKVETPVEKKAEYDESFDPLSLEDDDISIARPSKTETEIKASSPITDSNELPFQEINGYRIQILATDNIETASLVEQEATDRFARGGHKVYLIFEAPLYKIRVGDCRERLAAEELRDSAKQYGYQGAFIVKSKVIPSEEQQ